jgi:hypothetical protein
VVKAWADTKLAETLMFPELVEGNFGAPSAGFDKLSQRIEFSILPKPLG